MIKEIYSIPTIESDQFEFQHKVIAIVNGNFQQWQIAPEMVNTILSLQFDYEQKYSISTNKNMQSLAAANACNAAWNLLKAALTELYDQSLLHNPHISVAEKEALHIYNYGDSEEVSGKEPVTTPIISLVAEKISVLCVVYSDSATPEVLTKPDNVAFCKLACKIGEPAPADISECTIQYNISRLYHEIEFRSDQRGKTMYAYARWMNKNGRFGPWSSMTMAVIP